MTTSPALIRDDADREAYRRVEAQGAARRATAAIATPIARSPLGLVDLVIETGLKPHDVVALAPIVDGAGGS